MARAVAERVTRAIAVAGAGALRFEEEAEGLTMRGSVCAALSGLTVVSLAIGISCVPSSSTSVVTSDHATLGPLEPLRGVVVRLARAALAVPTLKAQFPFL